MLIHDLSHFEILNQSSGISGASQPDDGFLTVAVSEDNTVSVKQGNTELWKTKSASPLQGISFSIPSNPNIAVSSATVATGGKSRSIFTLRFGTSPVGISFLSAIGLTSFIS